MIHKDEDTVVLLSPIEAEEESQKDGNSSPPRPFAASSISSSFLCGAGIFIANAVVWCREPREICKESEIFRITALFGGIISSLIVGRAVDYFGRRSSLMFSVLFWIIVTIFMVFLPSHAESLVNSYDAPLSKFYIWPTEHRASSVEFPPAYTIKAYDTEVSVSHIISYSYSQNSSLGNYLSPTQPTPIKSVSIQNYGSYLNAGSVTNDNISITGFSSSKGKMLEYSSLKTANGSINLNRISSLVPLLVYHMFLGAASAASIVSASIYTYETSPSKSQGRWLSLSDFFSSLFILCIPLFHEHLIFLATMACFPILALGFLMLIPINFPDWLSLPHSPHFLLLSIFIQRRNALFSNSVITQANENKGVCIPRKETETKKVGSVFQTYGHATLGYIKIPFKKAKIKIHDVSSKSSSSDSDDSSYFFTDKLKHLVLESKHEHLQPVDLENEAGTDSIQYQHSETSFLRETSDSPCAAFVENINGTEKSVDMEGKLSRSPEKTVNLIDGVVETCEEECGGQVNPEANEAHYECEMQGECATLVQQSWSNSHNPIISWQERESLRILSYLNGKKEGYTEWKNIKKMLKEDLSGMKYLTKSIFFLFDIHNFGSTLYLVTKVGLPLIIIHMFSCEYGTVVTLSETILSKLGFCDISGSAAITSIQVLSSGTSVLLLDKLRNRVVLKGAAVVMTASLIILGFLLPSMQKMVGIEQMPIAVVTPNPALPTLYPLLPTPLPQVLQGQESICSNNLIESSPSQPWDQVGIMYDSQKSIPLNLPIIWFAALVLLIYVLVSSFLLLPLTRLVLVSYFPIDRRGSCVGISISIEWILRLILIFFPYSFLNSSLGFSLYATASFSSILMLCVGGSNLFSRDSYFQHNNNMKKISHCPSSDRICNLSEVNSTDV